MVCIAVACESPLIPKSVNVTVATAGSGFTSAYPLVRKSCGCMTRGKFKVDCAPHRRGTKKIAMMAKTVVLDVLPVLIATEYRSDSRPRNEKVLESPKMAVAVD